MLAATVTSSEKQLRENPQFDVCSLQSCLPVELFDRNPICLVRQSDL
jgi:hypothetical protein